MTLGGSLTSLGLHFLTRELRDVLSSKTVNGEEPADSFRSIHVSTIFVLRKESAQIILSLQTKGIVY